MHRPPRRRTPASLTAGCALTWALESPRRGPSRRHDCQTASAHTVNRSVTGAGGLRGPSSTQSGSCATGPGQLAAFRLPLPRPSATARRICPRPHEHDMAEEEMAPLPHRLLSRGREHARGLRRRRAPKRKWPPLPHRLPHRPGRSRTVQRCPETHIVSCAEKGIIRENAHKHSLLGVAGNRLQARPIGLRNRRSQVRILSGASKFYLQTGTF
jgi:hypothetical protein